MKRRESEMGSLIEKQTTVMMTGEEIVRVVTPSKGKEEEELGLIELGSSPLGNFQSTDSSQSSEKDRTIPYVSPLEKLQVLQFDYTLLEEDHENFDLIYESLLLEGRAGNLTDLTLGMVLAEKPPDMVTGHACKAKASDN